MAETDNAVAPEQVRKIVPNSNPNVEMKEASFRFKKDDLGNKRPNVEVHIPVPNASGLVTILEKGGKELDLVLEALYGVVRGVAQEMVSENENIKGQDDLDLSKLSWEAIANMPKEDRRSNSIAPELWTAFAKKYIDVMPTLTGKSVEAVTNATLVYLKKFAQFKTDKDTLRKLKQQLAMFAETQGAEEFADILELLVRRADTYLAADDVAALRANL